MSCASKKEGKSHSLSGSCLDTLPMITFMPAPNSKGHFVWTQFHSRRQVVGDISSTPVEHSCTRWENIHNSCTYGHILPWPCSSKQIISCPTEMSCSLEGKLWNDATLEHFNTNSVSFSPVYPLGFDFYITDRVFWYMAFRLTEKAK